MTGWETVGFIGFMVFIFIAGDFSRREGITKDDNQEKERRHRVG